MLFSLRRPMWKRMNYPEILFVGINPEHEVGAELWSKELGFQKALSPVTNDQEIWWKGNQDWKALSWQKKKKITVVFTVCHRLRKLLLAKLLHTMSLSCHIALFICRSQSNLLRLPLLSFTSFRQGNWNVC